MLAPEWAGGTVLKIPVNTTTVARYLDKALGAVEATGGVPGVAARVARTLINGDERSTEDRILIALRDGPKPVIRLVEAVGAAAVPPAIESLHKLRLVETEDVDGDLVVSLARTGAEVAAKLK